MHVQTPRPATQHSPTCLESSSHSCMETSAPEKRSLWHDVYKGDPTALACSLLRARALPLSPSRYCLGYVPTWPSGGGGGGGVGGAADEDGAADDDTLVPSIFFVRKDMPLLMPLA